jgi:hypothetical protein
MAVSPFDLNVASQIPYAKGKTIGLSLPRRLIGDLLHFAKRVPGVPMQRRMRLASVIEARANWKNRPSWCAIFTKAFGHVAAEKPEFRRAFLPLPWGRLYEHPQNVATFTIERRYRGEPGVFFAKIAAPETIPLATLDQFVRAHKTMAIGQIESFKKALWFSGAPTLVRRLAWWLGLDVHGPTRARYFGTFGVSSTASLGASSLHILSPLTTALNYGVFDSEGELDVRLVYDHRVLDGSQVARGLEALEETLLGPVLAELRAGASRREQSLVRAA